MVLSEKQRATEIPELFQGAPTAHMIRTKLQKISDTISPKVASNL
ncbi:MAG TPA: hypothetical protein VKA09_13825 [Nitrososphaeraceae archaeon]|nr:hypothetical protein [Nitrososphaeraceae archaeon]